MNFKQLALSFLAALLAAPTPFAVCAENGGLNVAQSAQGAESTQESSRKIEQTLDAICGKANDWHEPSLQSERLYVGALRRWLNSLQPFQQERARQILKEARPAMRDLRKAIREKKAELAELSFDRNTAPETLPRLGMELQQLRADLRHKLQMLSNRLYFEAGVRFGPLGDDGFWLVPSPPGQPVIKTLGARIHS